MTDIDAIRKRDDEKNYDGQLAMADRRTLRRAYDAKCEELAEFRDGLVAARKTREVCCTKALADQQALLAKRDAAVRDAQRYRWIKESYSATWKGAVTGTDGVSWDQCWELRVYLPTQAEPLTEAEVDAAIDAELAALAPPTEQTKVTP